MNDYGRKPSTLKVAESVVRMPDNNTVKKGRRIRRGVQIAEEEEETEKVGVWAAI